MKKIKITTVCLLVANFCIAQWIDTGSTINTSDNVEISGTLDANGNSAIHRLTISNSSNAGSNTIAELYRATFTLGSGNQLVWKNNNTSGSQITTGYMHSVLRTNTLGSEMAKWEFRGLVNGTQTEMLEFGDHGFYFKPLGTSVMAVMPDGNVGIGTTSPNAPVSIKAEINSTSYTNGLRINSNSDGSTIRSALTATDSDNGRLLLYNDATALGTMLNVDGTNSYIRYGKLGIGTTSPTEKVSISDASANHLGLVQSVGKSWQFRVGSTGGLIFKDDGVERMRFLPSGYIGLGTNSPTEKMTISEASANHLGLVQSAGKSWQFRVGSTGGLIFKDDGIERMRFNSSGYLGIGTNDPKSKLAVNGQIRATEVKVLADITVPDYVFESDYNLPTLKETRKYITENKHLPEIPSAAEIGENGIDLGDMNMRLLKKIEELTLHLIEQNERVEKLEKEVSTLRDK